MSAANHRLPGGPPAFLDLEGEAVARLRAEDLGELGGDEQAIRRKRDGPFLVVEEPIEHGIARQAGDSQPPRAMAEGEPRRHAAKWLRADHAGKMPHITENPRGARLDEAERHVLPLATSHSKHHDVVDAVAHRARDDGDARGQRQAEGGEEGLPGLALEIAQRHAKRWTRELRQAELFEQ